MGRFAVVRGIIDHMRNPHIRREAQRTAILGLMYHGKEADARASIAPGMPPAELAALLGALASGEDKAGRHDVAVHSLGQAIAVAQEARKARALSASDVAPLLDIAYDILGSG